MSCGCAKKRPVGQIIGDRDISEPSEWGPAFWRILHCLADKLGTGNSAMDTDSARFFEHIISDLCFILPCKECQAHCQEYLSGNPRKWVGLTGSELKTAISKWLEDFHNAVNIRLGKEVVTGIDYSTCTIKPCDYEMITENIVVATKIKLVKLDIWKRWFRSFTQLRLLLGV